MSNARILSFRRRLTQLVSTTEWAHQADTPQRLEELARSLGISVDILAAAREMVVGGRKLRGLKPPLSKKVDERSWPQLEICMPERIFNDWHSWCESQHAKSSALLRGIIHAYLLGSWEPAWVASFWRYRGETLPIQLREHRKQHGALAWPWRERVLVTPGAKGALNLRAKVTATSPTAITRGLVIEILEGRYKNVLPRDAMSMFDDPLRYRR